MWVMSATNTSSSGGRKSRKYRQFMAVVKADDPRVGDVMDGLEQRRHHRTVRWAEILHDRDKGLGGREVDAHHHLVFCSTVPLETATVARYLGLPTPSVRVLTGGEKGLARYLRYLTHENPDPDLGSPGQQLYDDSEVSANFAWREVVEKANLPKYRKPRLKDVQVALLQGETTLDSVIEEHPDLFLAHQAALKSAAKTGHELRERRRVAEIEAARAEREERAEMLAEFRATESVQQVVADRRGAPQPDADARSEQDGYQATSEPEMVVQSAPTSASTCTDVTDDLDDVEPEEPLVDRAADVRDDAKLTGLLEFQGITYDAIIPELVMMPSDDFDEDHAEVESEITDLGGEMTLAYLARYFAYQDIEDNEDLVLDDISDDQVRDQIGEIRQRLGLENPASDLRGEIMEAEYDAEETEEVAEFNRVKDLRLKWLYFELGEQPPVREHLPEDWKAELQAIAGSAK